MLYIYLYGILVVLFTLGRLRDVMPYAVPLASRATEYLMVKSCMSADGGDNFLLQTWTFPLFVAVTKHFPALHKIFLTITILL